MKRRFIAMLVAVIMVLSMIPAMSFTASAADIEGDWDTFRSGTNYKEPELDPETGEMKVPTYTPAPGYQYTSEGFVCIPASYENTTPFMTVQSKETQPIKEGVYMEFRIDDYAYGGPDGSADHWVSVSLWSQQKIAPGNVKHGEGWLSLNRMPGNGAATGMESYNTVAYDPDTDTAGQFIPIGGGTSKAPQVDDEGREIWTFEVTFDGTNYDCLLNGVSYGAQAVMTENLNRIDPNGEFYVGITLYSNVKNGAASISILKYGNTKSNATIPVGSDSKEPEENMFEPYAEIADPSTVEANMPCFMVDATTNTSLGGGQMESVALGDNAFRIEPLAAACFVTFSPKRSVSYDAKDFPVVAMLLRNYLSDGGSMYYSAGEIMSGNPNYLIGWSVWDGEFYGEDEEYNLVLVDLTDMWEGRINSARFDFGNVSPDDPFDICYVGFFRNIDEAIAYNETRLIELGVSTAPVTEAPTEEATEAPTVEGDDTSAPVDGTTAEDGTGASADGTTANTEGETKAEETGCASVIVGSGAILMAACAAFVLRKKR